MIPKFFQIKKNKNEVIGNILSIFGGKPLFVASIVAAVMNFIVWMIFLIFPVKSKLALGFNFFSFISPIIFAWEIFVYILLISLVLVSNNKPGEKEKWGKYNKLFNIHLISFLIIHVSWIGYYVYKIVHLPTTEVNIFYFEGLLFGHLTIIELDFIIFQAYYKIYSHLLEGKAFKSMNYELPEENQIYHLVPVFLTLQSP